MHSHLFLCLLLIAPCLVCSSASSSTSGSVSGSASTSSKPDQCIQPPKCLQCTSEIVKKKITQCTAKQHVSQMQIKKYHTQMSAKLLAISRYKRGAIQKIKKIFLYRNRPLFIFFCFSFLLFVINHNLPLCYFSFFLRLIPMANIQAWKIVL